MPFLCLPLSVVSGVISLASDWISNEDRKPPIYLIRLLLELFMLGASWLGGWAGGPACSVQLH